MFRCMVSGFLALGLCSCSAEGGVAAWHWNAFLKAPDAAHFKPLYGDVKACTKRDCPQGDQITEPMIHDLADLVRAKNHSAVRIGVVAQQISARNPTAATYLNASFSDVISEEPVFFLTRLRDERVSDFAMVLTTPASLADNDTGQYIELRRRRDVLATVSQPDLIATRDTVVTALDARIAVLEKSRIYAPPLPPVF